MWFNNCIFVVDIKVWFTLVKIYYYSHIRVLVCVMFYKRRTRWKHLSAIGLVPKDVACWMSWGEYTKTSNSTGSFWRPSFYCLLSFTFITFLFHWPMSPANSNVSWCLFWTYIWNIQWRCSHYVRMLCGLLVCDSNPDMSELFLCLYTLLDSQRNFRMLKGILALFTP